MRRCVKNIPIGDGKTRFRLTIEDDPSTPPGADVQLRRFIQALADQPELLRCGPGYFRDARLYHGGMSWILQAELIADDAQSF